jgi:SAM-dependent methyltransferase
MASFIKKIKRSFRKDGFFQTLKLCGQNLTYLFKNKMAYVQGGQLEADYFDRQYGVNTGGIVEVSDLGIDYERHCWSQRYQPTPVGLFQQMMNGLAIRYEDFLFIDIGSGKGRTLLMASELPFIQIIGVELSEKLVAVSRMNVSQYTSTTQRCRDIQTVCIDATLYVIPNYPSVFYFYNPFQDEVLKSVLENIYCSLKECPRELFIVYCNPNPHSILKRCDWLYEFKTSATYSIYRTAASCRD